MIVINICIGVAFPTGINPLRWTEATKSINMAAVSGLNSETATKRINTRDPLVQGGSLIFI